MITKKPKNRTIPDSSIELREYAEVLADIKRRIEEAQIKAVLSANKELIKLYWSIGQTIAEKQATSNWGTGIVENLAKDLQSAFPGVSGFSPANVFRMRAFYLAYAAILSQAVIELENYPIFNIPWGHNVILLIKVKDNTERLWYAQKAIEHGWSRSMLETWIKSNLYAREGKAITNFKRTLPSSYSDIAQQSIKDPFLFNFLTLQKDYIEKDLEDGLVNHMQKFLLELGKGFAFVGRQYHIQVSDKDFYIDLLFYHLKLRSYIAVELKAREFSPCDIGQLHFYLSVIDDLLRHPDDKPTIGLLLCKTKDNIIAEYALRDINKPIGISGYETEIVENLPKELKSSLPTIEEIEAELEKHELLAQEEKKIKVTD